jgi:SAM-dependent methyltransferase
MVDIEKHLRSSHVKLQELNKNRKEAVLTLDGLAAHLRGSDTASYYALATVRRMHGDAIKPYADDIFNFLNRRRTQRPFDSYLKRIEGLRLLQAEFEKTGKYPLLSNEVTGIPDEQYKLSLLLSFISTNHRFEILRSLVSFLRAPCVEPNSLLSIGYGTGYELKLAFDEMPGCDLLAFDSSPESYEYASELLRFFGYPTGSLRQEHFPLNSAAIEARYRCRFGKVILCELLEHLDNPAMALESVRNALAPQGLLFCTMAVNIAQEDHIYHYNCADQARSQVLDHGFEIVTEILAPVVILPFPESKRVELFNKGNYVCVARRK